MSFRIRTHTPTTVVSTTPQKMQQVTTENKSPNEFKLKDYGDYKYSFGNVEKYKNISTSTKDPEDYLANNDKVTTKYIKQDLIFDEFSKQWKIIYVTSDE